ncbi:hypothetical protein ACN27F_19975 [Solwaraspora sp. WMMB335]|uniref:hypothetical protein n=1 Tax=Solwaraspora sp. WMMB335 TaxID=3404118 RepID=UPI003B95DFD4
MDWTVLLNTTLVWSAIFAVAFVAILVGGMLIAPDSMVHDYPPAIRDRYGPKSTRGERVGHIMSALMGLLVLSVAIGVALSLAFEPDADTGFWSGFLVGCTLVVLLNLFDLVVLDWIVFCWIQPRFMVLPGTEGMPEYRDWLFHLRVLVPRPVPWPLLLIPAYGVIVGAATVLIEALV